MVDELSGSMAIARVGKLGKAPGPVPLRSDQVVPAPAFAFVVCHTCPTPLRPIVTHNSLGFVALATMPLIQGLKKPHDVAAGMFPVTLVQVVPPSIVRHTPPRRLPVTMTEPPGFMARALIHSPAMPRVSTGLTFGQPPVPAGRPPVVDWYTLSVASARCCGFSESIK